MNQDMILIMEQTVDLMIAKDPNGTLELLWLSEAHETVSGVGYLKLIEENGNNQNFTNPFWMDIINMWMDYTYFNDPPTLMACKFFIPCIILLILSWFIREEV